MTEKETLRRSGKGLPPGPRMPSPVQLVGWLRRPMPFMQRCQARYGDVFTLRVAPTEGPWVMLAHPDAVREVFTGDPEKLRAGEGNRILEGVLGSRSVLLLDGREHLRQRRLLLPPFHGERMERYGAIVREAAAEEIARWPKGRSFPLAPRMQNLTLTVILHAVFGTRDEGMRRALAELLELTTRPASFLAVSLLGTRVNRLPIARRTLGKVDQLIYGEIASRRAATDLAARDDILSLLVQARHEDGSEMSDQDLRDELVTLLVAGHETTATALAWAIERLLRHPEAFERLRSGEEPYLDAVCQETLRLRPVLPLVLRRLAEPMRIAGHDLPAGVKVAPCIHLVHRRPDVYPDPHAFRPERFLERPPGTYTWIPFGGGVRRCLGAAFALFEMRTVLAAVAETAELRPAHWQPERVGRRAITLAPARGAEVVAA